MKVTRHFLIVQSKGRGDEWAKLFEDAHQSFLTYMRLRGVVIREGRFPMVAVVMPDEQAMQREFQNDWELRSAVWRAFTQVKAIA